MTEPTTEDIRRAIAEFMGWSDVHIGGPQDGDYEGFLTGKNPRALFPDPGVPDYPRNLAEMWAIERELERRGLHWAYVAEFQEYCAATETEAPYGKDWFMLHATAEQRARAAYATIKAIEALKATDP